MPASLARSLPRRARGRASRDRDRRADFLATRRGYVSLHRAAGGAGWAGRKRRGPGTGGPARAGAGAGAGVNITALVAGKWRKAEPQARKHEHRGRSRSVVPAAERSEAEASGVAVRRVPVHAPRSGRAQRVKTVPCLSPVASGSALKRNESRPLRASLRGRGRRRSGAQGSERKRRSQAPLRWQSAVPPRRPRRAGTSIVAGARGGRRLPPPACPGPRAAAGASVAFAAWHRWQRSEAGAGPCSRSGPPPVSEAGRAGMQ